jgi:CBS domain containing-hemolysin-like protein
MSSGDLRGERRSEPPSLIERMRSLFGLNPNSVRDDIEDALDEPGPDAVFSPQERTMLRNVLNLHEIRVEDIMVPRSDIVAVEDTATLKTVLAVFRDAAHSRLPVHGETLDDLKGMIHIRDFVHVIAEPGAGDNIVQIDMGQSVAEAGVVRSVLFVPPSMLALDLLVRMQATRTHMALVIDEFGGTDGLVTIEDIVEVIVGDIADEHDEDETPAVIAEAGGGFLADARADLDEATRLVGAPLATDGEAEGVDTLGGLVTTLAGRVPAIGESVSGEGRFTFEVLDADPRRVKRVRIRQKPAIGAVDAPGSLQNIDLSS